MKEKTAAIVVSRFNQMVTKPLLEGALEAFFERGFEKEEIEITWVPGAFEIPLAAQRHLKEQSIALVVCLGAIIRGETAHFDYVAMPTSISLSNLMTRYEKPIGFGVLTCETVEQALDRSGGKRGNKGYEAAISALEMIPSSPMKKVSSKNE